MIPATAMAAEPQTLGRYKIERVLGKGAMGVVYEALDPKLHRKVAIKTILISQLDEETAKDFSMRFEREAHAVARLNHPNIVQVYDFGEEGGVAYLVMEFIRGNELRTALATGQNRVFDRAECVRIMCELLDALDFAHDAGVIHRDIKPANVMLDSQGRTKLTDFGVARVTDADRTNAERTQAGTMVGTPAYMSPEQIQGHRIDRRTDIFSAGIILYQFLTGQKPFTGEGAWTVAKKIIQDEPPTPSSLNVGVPREYDRIVAKALAKNPDDRFSTAKEFAVALKRAAEGKQAFEDDAAPTVVVPRRETSQARSLGEMELEFWRSIKDSDDPNDFELYIRQFPQGTYASLAGRRIAKLRGLPLPAGSEDSGSRPTETTARTQVQTGPRAEARPTEVEKTVKLAREPAAPAPAPRARRSPVPLIALVLLLAGGGASAYFFLIEPGREAARAAAEEKARNDAAEKARRDADAKAQAEAQAQREARARAQREAEARAQREAQARAQREAQAKAQRDAELQARREADLKAKAVAEQAKRDAEAKAKREADAKARQEAEARARLQAESTLWDSIKGSSNAADFQNYLDRYPSGRYADRARKRLAALQKEEQKRVEAAARKAKQDEQKRAQEQAAEDARQKSEPEKKKPAIIVPPTF